MDKWQNKVAVVTGASAGIGAACCIALVKHGMVVVGLARRHERIEKLRDRWQGNKEKPQRLHALKCDVRNEKDVVQTFKKIANDYGSIAVLIKNVGIVRDTELIRENNTEDLCATIETNVMGVTYCTRGDFKAFPKNDNGLGHVIIMNSIAGHKVPHFPGMSGNMYPPTKHALTAMAEVYRNEFSMHNSKIKVTSISPGIVSTEIFPERALDFTQKYPYLESSDIADAVIYCLQTPPHVHLNPFPSNL